LATSQPGKPEEVGEWEVGHGKVRDFMKSEGKVMKIAFLN